MTVVPSAFLLIAVLVRVLPSAEITVVTLRVSVFQLAIAVKELELTRVNAIEERGPDPTTG